MPAKLEGLHNIYRVLIDEDAATEGIPVYTLPPILCLSKFLKQLKNPYFERPNSTHVPTMCLNPENPVDPV